MKNQNEIYRKRYAVLRAVGYSPSEARRLRGRALDVKGIRINRKTNKVINRGKGFNKVVNEFIKKRPKVDVLKKDELTDIDIDIDDFEKDINIVDNFKNEMYNVKNDTTYSRWGMLTQDKRYKDNTAKIVAFIKDDLNIRDNQAYYFLYIMLQGNLTYQETKDMLLTSEEFEMYRQSKGKRKV